MHLTDDLFFEVLDTLFMAPKGTVVKEWHDKNSQDDESNENDVESPDLIK